MRAQIGWAKSSVFGLCITIPLPRIRTSYIKPKLPLTISYFIPMPKTSLLQNLSIILLPLPISHLTLPFRMLQIETNLLISSQFPFRIHYIESICTLLLLHLLGIIINDLLSLYPSDSTWVIWHELKTTHQAFISPTWKFHQNHLLMIKFTSVAYPTSFSHLSKYPNIASNQKDW